MAVKQIEAIIFDDMARRLFFKLSYIFLITLTCLSFGTFILLDNFKPKTEKITNDFAEEKAQTNNETSKEITKNFLIANTLNINYPITLAIQKYPSITFKIASLSLKPSTPPPDLFEI
jgi:hypothetical protein